MIRPACFLFVSVLAALAIAPCAFAADGTFDELLPKIAAYDYGADAAPLDAAADLMTRAQTHGAQNDPAQLRAMAAKLAALLTAESTTDAAKLFICRQIYLFGGKDCIPSVAPLLLKQATADMACYAIDRMPGEEAARALVAALAKTEPAAKVAIVDALGQRKDPETSDVLAKAAHDADKAVAQAAIAALGLVGTQPAAAAIEKLWSEAPGAVEPALIDAAAQLVTDNATLERGAKIYQKLLDKSKNPATRAAALKALACVRGSARAMKLIVQGLNDTEPIVRTAAADALRELPDEVAGAFGEKVAGLAPAAQVMVITVFADRAAPGTCPAVTDLVTSTDATVRLAAIEALAKLGNEYSSVSLLAQIAAGDDDDDAKAARKSLARINGPAIDGAFVKLLQAGDVGIKSEALGALADRNARQLVPEILKVAADPDENLRQDAFKTLAKLGRPEDAPALIDLLVKETADGPRSQAETAVVAAARKAKDPAGATAAALAAFDGTKGNVPARAALVRVLGKLGDNSALDALRADLESTDAQLQEAAVRALMEWPTAAPVEDLGKVAESGATDTVKKLALRGYLRLAGLAADQPVEKRVAMYEKGLELASEPGEKVMALAGLAECPSTAAYDVIKRYENDPQVGAEAKLALEKINNPTLFTTASDNAAEAGNAIDGKPETRWTTGTNQAPGQWFQIDLGWPAEVSRVVLDSTNSGGDYPKKYEVYVSDNTQDWGEPVAKGRGDQPVTDIACTPKAGRYVRIVQTGQKDGLWWSIHELKIEKRPL
ncbi:MAG TPA: HEAT repeat domain-containing protein [Candidatus Bathyarchaeia archaeon]|nr:HEAT repeat domain-containing protein [Candidatus Bathyarchaeia archaeon]